MNKFVQAHKNIILAEHSKVRSRSASSPLPEHKINKKLNYGSTPNCSVFVLPPIQTSSRNVPRLRPKQGPCRSQLPPKPVSKQEKCLEPKPIVDNSQKYARLSHACIDHKQPYNQYISKIPIPISCKPTPSNPNFSASTFKNAEPGGHTSRYDLSAVLFAEISAIKSSLKSVQNSKYIRRSADESDEKNNISVAELLKLTLEQQRCTVRSEDDDINESRNLSGR